MTIPDTQFNDLHGRDIEDQYFIGCEFLKTDLRDAQLRDARQFL